MQTHAILMGYMSSAQGRLVKDYVCDLTWEIGESAVRLIDAIAYPDFVVGSALGHSDGQVYQRLLDAIESAKGVYDIPSWFSLLKQLRSSYISAVVPPCLSHNSAYRASFCI